MRIENSFRNCKILVLKNFIKRSTLNNTQDRQTYNRGILNIKPQL